MIPSYFVDDATLLHGTSSLNVVGGGLGGAITLATKPADTHGFKCSIHRESARSGRRTNFCG